MRRVILVFSLLSAIINSMAQETGMQFVHNTSWKSILSKAKADNKYIFVDCYATWCGPCKMMSAKVFPQSEVGAFYNSAYINVKAQMDSSAADDAETKARYADNHILLTNYEIAAYPTYLIFNPNGELVQRFIGSMPADQFITRGKDALSPENQYYTQLRKFQEGERSPDFLKKLITMSMNAQDMKNGNMVLNAYLQTQSDLYSKENLDLILSFTHSSKDKGFEMMTQSPEKVDAVKGENASSNGTMMIIIQEELSPRFFSNKPDSLAHEPDWNSLQKELAIKYPARANEIISIGKVYFYQYNRQWEPYGPATAEYLKQYGDKASKGQLNDFTWFIYEKCSDPALTELALKWSKKTVETGNNFMFMDTYAHLLMKSGRNSEAVEWETKALAVAKEKNVGNLKEYEDALEEMKAKQ